MRTPVSIFALTLFVAASAGPISVGQQKCSSQCKDTDNFKYEPGKTYSYRYDGSVKTTTNGAMDSASGLHMMATADIEVIDKCNLVMKLKDVRLDETNPRTNSRVPAPGSSSFARAIEEKPLHFSYQDGRIDDICAADSEDTWVLNIKRGVLSTFQVTMEDFKIDSSTVETDISGECDTEYKVGDTAWRSFSISKRKNLIGCTGRQFTRTALQATPYRVDSGIQSMPLTKGTYTCHHDIHNNGYLMKTECEEEQTFRPFSRENNGATTRAINKLVFVAEFPTVSSRPMRESYRRTNLLYEHEEEPEKNTRDMNTAMDVLRTICEQMKQDVRPKTPKVFADLVYKLKDMDTRTLSKLFRYVNNNGVCRDNHQAAKTFFMDAIPMVGSTASVALIGDLVSQRIVQGPAADMWLSSLVLVQTPTTNMLSAIKTLLESVSATRTTFLSGSALVHNYCKKKATCLQDPLVQQISSTLEGKLNYNCRVRGTKDKDRVMMALKALGNMGHAPRAIPTITRCMMEKSNAIDVRLAAIDALRRQPCGSDRARVLNLFSDTDEDSEIRIAAYLAAMQCANSDVIETVRVLLNNEKVNQVGSFVWTHLTNLKETSDPLKQELRSILENKHLQKEFDLDARKYSRNFEGSMFSESLNAGANVEGNLIWSPKSFVPRSAMVNLTVDLFGESVNLLEFGGRVEGLERMLETFFGQKGYFSDNSLSDILKRPKRSAFDDKINRIDRDFNDKRSKVTKGSMYFRMFGHEIRYMDFAEMTGKSDFNILELLIKLANNHDVNFSKSMMFIDTTVTLPTILGMPLKLSVNGTATVNLQMKGKFDVRQAFTSPRSMDITGTIKPSGAVEVSSLMSIDAFVAKAGLKMVTNLHTSTEIDGSIKMEDGQAFITKVNMPREKVEILNAENKFYLVHGDEDVEMTMPNAKIFQGKKCTGETVRNIIGVEVCGEISYPVSDLNGGVFAPLAGPCELNIALSKKDTMTAYEFEARFQTRKDRHDGQSTHTHLARVAFDTPGSKVNRAMSVDFLLNRGARIFTFDMVSPWKKASISAEMTNNDQLKQANFRFILDGKDEYSILTHIKSASKNDRITYTPNVQVVIPGRKTITVSGLLDLMRGRKVNVDLIMENLFENPVNLKGGIERENRASKTRYSGNVDIQSPLLETKLSGYIESRPAMYKSRMTCDYKMQNGVAHRVSMNYKLRNVNTSSMKKLSIDTAVQTTQFPKYNFEASAGLQKTDNHAEADLTVRYGEDDQDPNNRIAAAVIVNREVNGDKFKADGSAKLHFPAKNIDVSIKLNHNHDTKGVQTKGLIKYQTDREIKYELNLQDLSTGLLKMTGDLTIELPSRVLSMSHQLEEREAQEYHHGMVLQWKRGMYVQTKSMYKVTDETRAVSSSIELPGRQPIILKAFTKLNPRNFGVSMKVEYDRKTYGGDLSYKYVNTYDQLVAEGNIDLQHPRRRIIGSVSVKRQEHDIGTSLNLKWDANGDQSQSIDLAGSYKSKSLYRGQNHVGNFKISYPGRVASVDMNVMKTAAGFKCDALAKWEEDKIITLSSTLNRGESSFDGSIKLTTPFKYIENIGGSFAHRNHGYEIVDIGTVSWGTDQTIKIESSIKPISVKNLEMRFIVSTPFPGFSTINAHAMYLLSAQSFSGLFEGDVVGEKMTVSIEGSREGGYRGSMRFVTPFMMQPVVASFNQRSEGGIYDTSFELSWSESKKLGAQLKVKPESLRDMEFTASVNTPFVGYKTLKIQGVHKIDNNEITSKVFGQFDLKKAGLELTGKTHKANDPVDIEGNLKVSTPFESCEEMVATFKHTKASSRYSSSAMLSWAQDKKIAASLYMTYARQEWNVLSTGRLQVVTPFQGYEGTLYNWRHNNAHGEISSSHTLNIKGDTFLASVSGKYPTASSPRTVEGKIIIETPLEFARHLEAEMTLGMTDTSFTTSVIFATEQDKKIKIGLEGSYDANSKFMGKMTVDLSALLPEVSGLTAAVNGQLKNIPYSSHVEVEWAAEKKVTFDFTITPHDWKQFESNMEVQTPFSMVRNAAVKMTSEIGNNGVSGVLSVKHNDKTAEVQISCSRQSKYYGSDTDGTIKVTSPYTQDVTLSFRHTTEGKKLITSLRGAYGNEKVEGNLNIENNINMPEMSSKGTLTLSLPVFGEREEISYEWDHYTDMKSVLNTKNAVTLNGKSIVLNMDLTATNDYYGSSSSGKLVVQTPLQMAREIKIEAGHQKRGNIYRNNMKLEINQVKKADFTLQTTKKGIYSFEGLATLAIAEMDPVSAKFKIQAAQYPYDGLVEITWSQSRKVTLSGSIDYKSPEHFKAAVDISSPYQYFEKVGMKVDHSAQGNSATTSVGIEYAAEQTVTISTKFDKDRKTGMISISTPFDVLKTVKLTYEHEGTTEGFHHQNNIKYSGMDMVISADNTLNYNGAGDVTGSMHFTSPFQYFEDVRMNFVHREHASEYTTNVDVELQKDKKIEITSLLEMAPTPKYSLNLKSPYRLLKTLTANFEHSGDFPYTVTKGNFEMQNSFVRVSLNGDVSINGADSVSARMRLITPIKYFEHMFFTFTHERMDESWRSTLEGQLDMYRKLHIQTTLSTDSEVQGTIEATFPFIGLEKAFLSFHTEGPFASSVSTADYEMYYQGKTTKLQSEIRITGVNDIRATVSGKTPFSGWETVAFSATHGKDGNVWTTTANLDVPSGKTDFLSKVQTGDLRKIDIAFTSPLGFLQSLNLNLEQKGDLNDFHYKLMFNYVAFIFRINLSNEIVVRGIDYIDAKFRLTSPFKHLEFVNMAMKHVRQDERWTTNATFEYAPREEVTLNSDVQLGSPMKIDITASTPFETLRQMSFDFEHNPKTSFYENKISATLNDRELIKSHFHIDGLRMIKGKADINGKIIDIEHEIKDSELETIMKVADLLEFTANFDNHHKTNGKILLSTPHEMVRSLSLVFEYASDPSFETTAHLNYDGSMGPSRIDASLKVEGLDEIAGNVHIVGLMADDLEVTFDHRNRRHQYTTSMDIESGRKKIAAYQSNMRVSPLHFDASFTTMYDCLKKMTVKIDHSGYDLFFTNGVSIAINTADETINIETSTKAQGLDAISGHAHVRSSLFSDINLEVSHKEEDQNRVIGTTLDYGSRQTFAALVKYNFDHGFMMRADIDTPFEFMKKAALEIDHLTEAESCSTNIKFTHNLLSEPVTYFSEVKTGAAVEGRVAITSGCPYLESVIMDFTHAKDVNRRTTHVGVTYRESSASIHSEVDFKSINQMSGVITIKPPLERIGTIRLEFTHQVDSSSINSEFSIEAGNQGKFTIGVSLKIDAGFEGAVTLKTPFFDDVKVGAMHKSIDYRKYNSVFEITVGKKEISLESELSIYSLTSIEGSLTLVTPFETLPRLKVSFNHHGGLFDFRNGLSLETRFGTFAGSSTVLVDEDVAVDVEMKTPWERFSNIKVGLKHNGNAKDFKTSIIIDSQYDGHMEATASCNIQREIDAKFDLKTPFFEDLHVEFNTDSEDYTYITAGMLRYGEKTFSYESKFTIFINLLMVELTVKSPIERFTQTTVRQKLHFRRDMGKTFITTATYFDSAHYGKTNLTTNLKFFPTLEWTISMKTPYDGFTDVMATLNHQGDLQSFTTSATVMMDNVKTANLFVKWTNTPNATVKFEIVSPFLEKIDGLFEYEEVTPAYKTKVQAAYGRKMFSLDTMVSVGTSNGKNHIEAEIDMSTPLENMKKNKLHFKFEGNMKGVTTNLKLDNDRTGHLEIDATGSILPRVEGKMIIKSPFFEDINANFRHTVSWQGTSATVVSVAMGEENFLRSSVNVSSLQDMHGMLVMRSSYIESMNLQLTLNHKGDLSKFVTSAELACPRLEKSSMAIEWENGRIIEGKLKVISPLSNVELSFSHDGSMQRRQCVTEAKLTLNGDVSTISSNIDAYDLKNIKVNMDLKSPYSDGTLELTHVGDISSCTTQLKLTSDKGNVLMNAQLSTLSDFTAKMKINTPIEGFRIITADVTIAPSSINVVLSKEQDAITLEGKMTAKPHMSAEVVISSPFERFEKMSLSLGHVTSDKGFNSNAKIMYMTNKMFDASFSFKNDELRDIEIIGELKTPCPFFKTGKVTIKHTSVSFPSFTSSAKFERNQEQPIEMTIEFTSEPQKTELTAILLTPFKDLEKTEVKVTYTGELDNFEAKAMVRYMRNHVIETNVVFDNRQNINLFINVRTPFTNYETNELTFRYSHEGDGVSAHTSLSYWVHQNIEIDLKFHNTDLRSIGLDATIKTSIPDYRQASFAFKHNGEPNDFKATVELRDWKDQPMNAKLNFRNVRLYDLELSAKLNTPFQMARYAELSYKHRGDIEQFNCNGAIHYGTMEPITGTLSFKLNPVTEITGEVKTPFTNLKEASMKISIQSDEKSLKHTYKLDLMQKKYTFNVDFINDEFRDIQAVIKAGSPYDDFETVSVDFKFRRTTSLESSLVAKVGSLEVTNGMMEYDDLSGLIVNIKTPVTTLSITNKGELKNFKSTGSLVILENEVKAEMTLNMIGDLTIDVFLDGAPWSLDITHKGWLNDFASKVVVKHVTRGTYQAEAKFDSRTIEALTKLTSPTRSIEISHTGPWTAFTTKLAAICERATHLIEANLNVERATMMLKFSTPRREVSVNHEGGPENFSTKLRALMAYAGKYELEANWNAENKEGKIIMTSPYDEARITHTYENQVSSSVVSLTSRRFGNYNIQYTLDLVRMVSNLKASTPYFTSEMSHRGNIENFTAKGTSTIKDEKYTLEVTFNRKNKAAGFKFSSPVIVYSLSHSGTITNFKSLSSLTYYGQNSNLDIIFNMEKKISATFRFRSPFRHLELISLTFMHIGGSRSFETQGEVNWTPVDRIAALFNMRKGLNLIVANMKLETPYTEKMVANVNHQGSLMDFSSSINFVMGSKRTQCRVTFNDEAATASLTTPVENFESLSAIIKKTSNNKYHGEVAWTPKEKIVVDITKEIDGSLKAAAVTSSLRISTPFEIMKILAIEFENRHSEYTYFKNSLKVEMNSEKLWDTVAEIRVAADRLRVQANMAVPRPAIITMNTFSSEKEKNADLEVNVNGKRLFFNAFHKDESSYYRTKRDSSIKLVLPTRTMGVDSTFESSRYLTSHKVEVTLDKQTNKKILYEGSFADRSRSYQKNYEIVTKLVTPLRTLKTTVIHVHDHRAYSTQVETMWDADRDESKKMSVNTIYENHDKVHKIEVNFVHPRISKPISLRTEITLGSNYVIYAGKTELEYSADPEDKLTLSGKVNDESRGRGQNYSMSMQVSHPKSLIDMGFDSHIGSTDTKMSAGIAMNYLTARRSRENVILMGEIDQLRKSLNLQLNSPLKNIAVDANMKQTRTGGIIFEMMNTIDNTRLRHQLEIITRAPSFTLNMDYGNGKNIRLFGAANKTTAKIESHRFNGQRSYTDGLASINLNGTRVINAKLFWRPELIDEMQENTLERLTNVKTAVSKGFDNTMVSLYEEFAQHSELIRRSAPDMTEVEQYVMEQLESFNADNERMMKELKNMYERNEFYMRDVDQFLTSLLSYIKENVMLLQYQMRRHISALSRWTQIKLATFRRCLDEKMGKLEEAIAAIVLKFRPAWQSYAYAVIRSYQEASQHLRHRMEEMVEGLNEYKALFVNYVDDRFDFISYKLEPYLEKFGDLQHRLRYFLLSDKQKTYIDIAKERISQWAESIRAQLANWKETVTEETKDAVEDAKMKIRNQLDELIGHEYTQKVISMAQDLTVDLKKAYNDYEIRNKINQLMKNAYHKLDEYARKQITTLVKNYMRMADSGFTVFEPRSGEIEAKIFLPLEIKSLDRMPDINIPEMKKELANIYAKYKPNSDFSIWDVYYKYKPSSDVMNWIPPFKGHATLAHGKHFTTFDGRHFDFAGTCSYILTRDFDDANFTAIANYKDGTIKSYTIITDNKRIEVFPDFKLTVDGVRTEMPFEYLNTTIVRDADTIHIVNTKGFSFTFDNVRDIVTIDISGWYFAKVGGLFGAYDNEPTNDLMKPNHEVEEEINVFAAAWEAGSSYCRGSRNLARKTTTRPSSSVERACNMFFTDSRSPLRPCFKQVPNKPYYDICIGDVENDYTRRQPEQKACQVMEMYVAECKKAEVELTLPEGCSSCPSPRGDLMLPGDNVTFTTSETSDANSADVIFVVEEKQCNKEMSTRLPDIARQLDKALEGKGLKNNRIAVVAFGGHGAHNLPHPHTMENQIFNDLRKVNLVNLDFHEDGANTDVMDAVSYAAGYSFRPGVSKNIILVPCSECRVQFVSDRALYNQLTEQDITFHVAMSHDFRLFSNSPKSNFIFGVDSTSAYTSKDVNDRDLSGDSALFRQVIIPKDNCINIAFKTNGAMYNIQKLTEGRYTSQKAFLDILGRRIAQNAVPNEHQDCKCVADKNGSSKTVCKRSPTTMMTKIQPAQVPTGMPPLPTPPTMDYDETTVEHRVGRYSPLLDEGRLRRT